MDLAAFLVSHTSSPRGQRGIAARKKQSQLLPPIFFSMTSFLNMVHKVSKYLLLYQGVIVFQL